MAFIKLTRWDGEATYLVDFSCDMMLVTNDDGTTECRSPRAYSFRETPDAILAAIADASGGAVDEADEAVRLLSTYLRDIDWPLIGLQDDYDGVAGDIVEFLRTRRQP